MWMERSLRGQLESEKNLTIYAKMYFFRPYFEIWTQKRTHWDEPFVFSELEKRLTAMVTVGIFAYPVLPMDIFLWNYQAKLSQY